LIVRARKKAGPRVWTLRRAFGRFLLSQHLERGEPFVDEFAGDVGGHPPGRSKIRGLEAEAPDAFAGDVAAYPPGRDAIVGFEPPLLTPFENDVVEKALRRRIDSEFPFE
jgi:hypothetical protein